MLLDIKNIDKIEGESLESKWMPNTKGFYVESVEVHPIMYVFKILHGCKNTTHYLDLKRRPDGKKFFKHYSIGGWSESGEYIKKDCHIDELRTMEDCRLWLGYVLEQIREPNSINKIKI